MYCVDCGHPIARRFCRNCGAEQPSTLGGPGGSLEMQDESGGSIEMQEESTTTMRSGGPPNTPPPGPAEVPELDMDCCGNYSRRSHPTAYIPFMLPVRSLYYVCSTVPLCELCALWLHPCIVSVARGRSRHSTLSHSLARAHAHGPGLV
jgi:hypothetical protein